MGTTIHGQKRLVERLGDVKDASGWLARAYTKGKDIDHYSGRTRKFLNSIRGKTALNATIKVFSERICIFNEKQELVTILNFPKWYNTPKGKR